MNPIEINDRIKLVLNYSDSLKETYIHEPFFEKTNAYKYIKDCLDTGWVSSSGWWVSKFESLIQEFTGIKYAVAVSNGTVALRMALHLVGVSSGDEVLLPPLTFVGTANSISHLGGIPHFIDIEYGSLGMCPKALEKRLNEVAVLKDNDVYNKITGRKISAVVPVHVFGLPAKIQELKKLCSKWKLPLIEDAAEALGSKSRVSSKYIHCGGIGDLGTLSFNGNKIITTGGGGAILTNNKKFADLAKHLSTTAKIPHPWDFIHDQIGWNDRLPNINAALGASQIENLPAKLKNKRILHAKYKAQFQDLHNIEIMEETENNFSNYWLITMRINSDNPQELREKILNESHNSKIYLRPSWKLLNELPMYKKNPCGDLSEAINQSKRLINLPSSPQLILD